MLKFWMEAKLFMNFKLSLYFSFRYFILDEEDDDDDFEDDDDEWSD